jgi:hypothetical protein
MTNRSGRGRWQRVLDARLQAQLALGISREGEPFSEPPPKRQGRPEPPRPVALLSNPNLPSVDVLSVGEAALRLRMSRDELEHLIAVGRVKTVGNAYSRWVVASEVDRLAAPGRKPSVATAAARARSPNSTAKRIQSANGAAEF